MAWEKELELAKKAAKEASAAILALYEKGGGKAQYKKDGSPLTQADKTANEKILGKLREGFPTYAILSEEEQDDRKRRQNPYCFIVDPLDGTKEFLKRNGQFTVNIALAYERKCVVGVIAVPANGELYYAAQGKGAYKEEKGKEARRLHVREHTEELCAAVSLSHSSEKEKEFLERNGIKKILRMGSSLKGCLVAEGKADVYYRFQPTMEWDTAAMQCIVEEAGGVFRQMDGREMAYNRKDCCNRLGFYAASPLALFRIR